MFVLFVLDYHERSQHFATHITSGSIDMVRQKKKPKGEAPNGTPRAGASFTNQPGKTCDPLPHDRKKGQQQQRATMQTIALPLLREPRQRLRRGQPHQQH